MLLFLLLSPAEYSGELAIKCARVMGEALRRYVEVGELEGGDEVENGRRGAQGEQPGRAREGL